MSHMASWKKYTLYFKNPGNTSRGVLTQRDSWIIFLQDQEGIVGVGECGPLPGLSIDDLPNIEARLDDLCANIDDYLLDMEQRLLAYPSLQFGLECAKLNLDCKRPGIVFPSGFTLGERTILTNGLIWMGNPEFMRQQIRVKVDAGFNCIKLKIGAFQFSEEIEVIRDFRKLHGNSIEIRVDANGAFHKNDVYRKLDILASLNIHSIEQPVKAGQWEFLAQLCSNTPLPIALDEELIGNIPEQLLDFVKPQYLVLKPSLLGGFAKSRAWIDCASKYDIGWWITSALESNIGLNAIAQWTATLDTRMPQGLGTGMLFTNNLPSPLFMKGERLCYDPGNCFDYTVL
jgi:o-succinylbenzoate synthase